MKYEASIPEMPNYSNIINIPEILISDIEQLQVGFILSSFASEVGDACSITHAHDNFELQYVAEDEIELLVDNSRKLSLQKGDLLLLPPHMYHKVLTDTTNCRRRCINFSVLPNPGTLSENAMQVTDSRAQILSSVKQEIVFRNEEIQHFILKIFDSDLENIMFTFKNKLYLNMIFEEILTFLSNQKTYAPAEVPTNDDTYQINMQRKWIIETYVSHYYMYRNHTENLSQVLGLSPRQTSRVIRELMGCTLQELILTQRMMVAMESIKFSNMSLTQISDMLGYCTYYGFYTAFCKYYGVSPEQVSKQIEAI